MKKTTALRILVIIGAGLILTFPVLFYGLPKFADDSIAHASWYTHFAKQLWAGDLYPRWLIDMNEGLGSAGLFFYPPAPYYLTSLLYPFFINDPHGWHQLGVYASLALIASGLSAYVWLRKIVDENSAVIAAIIYMAMPYHLAVDLYDRGALPEFSTFVWMPLVLYFVGEITKDRKLAIIGLAVSYALLIMTHMLTTLIFSIVPVFYAFFTADARMRARALCLTLGAIMLGVGLSAIYLLPAMMTQEFISTHIVQTEGYYYEYWFLFSPFFIRSLPWGKVSFISFITLTMLLLACCAFVIARSSQNRKVSAFWLVVVVGSVFIMTPPSKLIWQTLSVLQRIHFPFRWSVVLAVATTVLLAFAISSLKRPYTKLNWMMLAVASLVFMSWIPATAWKAYHALPFAYQKQEAVNEINGMNRMIEVGIEYAEYRPRWVKEIEEWSQIPIRLLASKSEENLVKAKIVEGIGSVIVSRWEPRDLVLQVNTPSGAQLTVSQFYYPFWTARLIDQPHIITVQPSGPDGLLSIWVPSGNHQVSLRLEQSKPEHAGEIISAASAMITLGLVIYFCLERRKALLLHQRSDRNAKRTDGRKALSA